MLFADAPKCISSYLETSLLGGSKMYGNIISLMWSPVGECISQSLDIKKAQATGFITRFRLGALVLFLFAVTCSSNLLRDLLNLLPDCVASTFYKRRSGKDWKLATHHP